MIIDTDKNIIITVKFVQEIKHNPMTFIVENTDTGFYKVFQYLSDYFDLGYMTKETQLISGRGGKPILKRDNTLVYMAEIGVQNYKDYTVIANMYAGRIRTL